MSTYRIKLSREFEIEADTPAQAVANLLDGYRDGQTADVESVHELIQQPHLTRLVERDEWDPF